MKSVASIFIVITLTIGSFLAHLSVRAQHYNSVNIQQETAEERGIVALDQSLRELTNPFTLMTVAARPEDADYATLAYYRKKHGARTVLVFFTRGESGQLSSSASSPDPGATATERAIESAQSVGADVYFLNLSDLSYITSPDKVLTEWGLENAIGRLVRAIRLLRPDAIITSHTAETGDGQQKAVARLAQESFDAAADPLKFKEADTEPWSAARLFQPADQPAAQVTVNTGEYDHIRGLTYKQIGDRASAIVTSTARLVVSTRKEYYRLIRSRSGEMLQPGSGLLDGLALPENLRRPLAPPFVGNLSAVDAITQRERLIESLREKMTEKRAEGSIAEMRERYGDQFFRVLRYIESLERAIGQAYGLNFSVEIRDPILVQGQRLSSRLLIRNGSEYSFKVIFHTPESLPLAGQPRPYKATEPLDLFAGDSTSIEVHYDVPADGPLTLPRRDHLYDVSYYPVGSAPPGARAGGVFGNRLVVLAEVLLPDTNIFLPAQVRFDVAPPIEIETAPFVVIKSWEKPREIEIPVRLRNRFQGRFAGALWLVPLALTKDDYAPAPITFSQEDEEIEVRLRLTIPILKPPLAPDLLIEIRRERPAPPTPLASAKIKVTPFDFEVAESLKVGLVGEDRRISFALMQLGVENTLLSSNSIRDLVHGGSQSDNQSTCGDLGKYDSIIVTEHALSDKSLTAGARECLLEYARRGGNLVVFHQKADEWNLTSMLAPFPVRLADGQFPTGDSYVKIFDENHPLMARPNRITALGFNDWKQVMAASPAVEWSKEYTSLLEPAGTGGDDHSSGLLVARVGEGSYIYSSLELGRQVSDITAGAYRLLANLISFGKVIKEQSSR